MMAKRFIKVYEQIMSWEWFKHPNTLCLFIYLLLKANYKDLDYRGQTIKRGQILTSLTSISTGTGLSVQQARTALSHLISTGEVTDESTNQGRLITVVKYDEYQTSTGNSTGNQQAINKQPNRQSTSNLTSNLTPSIEYIEYIEKNRNIEQDRNILPPALQADFIEKSFATFWACYPKKRSKPEALRAWKKIKPDPCIADEIMTGLQKWSTCYDWLKENGRYIPYPATWLNNRGWEDDVPSDNVSEKPVKQVVAQQYEQRDYSGVQDQMLSDQHREIEERLRQKYGGV